VRAENGGFDINGSSSVNKTVATFIRLGDTWWMIFFGLKKHCKI
jgi:hypothetical protein